MTSKQPVTFDSVVEEMKALKAFADRVEGFRISDSIVGDWKAAAGLIQAGQEEKAVAAAKKPIEALRAILSAFVRNSVFPKKVPEGQTPPVPHFVSLIGEREEDNYDEDIVNHLRSKLRELETAVKTETNGSFDLRASAYAEMKAAIFDADQRQKMLDEKRQKGQWNVVKAKKKADGDGATAQQESAVARRQQMLADRQKRADEARSIF